MPAREELPSTIRRSDKHAQDIWAETHDSAVESYGEGERAHRTAFSALKHSYEKVGDHWEARKRSVDANASKAHLMEVAKRLDIRGRSRMSKDELVDAIRKANQRETAKARGR